MTALRLRSIEFDVLGYFAEGMDGQAIAEAAGIELDMVKGILVRRVQGDRGKARELVNGGAVVAEGASSSPLTAPIKKPAAPTTRSTAKRVSETTVTPAIAAVKIEPSPTTVDVPPPRYTSIEELLARADQTDDPKIRQIAGQVRVHVDSLRELIADEGRRIAGAKERIADLRRQLDEAYARLPAWVRDGGAA